MLSAEADRLRLITINETLIVLDMNLAVGSEPMRGQRVTTMYNNIQEPIAKSAR